MPFSVDEILAGLENDRSKDNNNGDNSDRLKKLIMNTIDNKGSIMFVPYPDGSTDKFWTKIQHVREYSCFTTKIKSEKKIWHKILPKEFYTGLTDSQSKLYDETIGMFDQVYNDQGKYGYDENSIWKTLRYRNYTLFYGYILNHKNESNEEVSDTINTQAILIYPSLKIIDTLADSINSKVLANKGKKEWINLLLSNEPKGRQSALVIKCSGGKGGYDFTVNIESNSPMGEVVPDDLDLTGKLDKFSDAIRDFLGWQNPSEDNKTYFNEDVFKEIYVDLEKTITSNQTVAEAPAVNNNASPTDDSWKPAATSQQGDDIPF